MNDFDLKATIIKILDISGYEGDKENYANEIFGKCLIKTLDRLIVSLPTEKQNELNKLAETEPDKNKAFSLLKSKFTDEEYVEEFKNVTEDVFGELMESIAPTLTNEKIEELRTFLTNLSKNTDSS